MALQFFKIECIQVVEEPIGGSTKDQDGGTKKTQCMAVPTRRSFATYSCRPSFGVWLGQ